MLEKCRTRCYCLIEPLLSSSRASCSFPLLATQYQLAATCLYAYKHQSVRNNNDADRIIYNLSHILERLT